MAKKVKKSVLDSMPYLEKYTKKKDEENSSIAPVTTSSTTKQVKQSVLDQMPYLKNNTTVSNIAPVREDNDSIFDGWFKQSESGIAKTILGTGSDLLSDLGTGIVGMGEKLVDSLANIAPSSILSQTTNEYGYTNPTLQQRNMDIYHKAVKESDDFVKKDLYDEEKVSKQILSSMTSGAYLNNIAQNGGQVKTEDIILSREMKQTAQKYLDEEMEKDSVLDTKTDSLVQSAGQLLATSTLQAAGVPWYLTTGVTTYGGEVENALNQDASHEDATLSGLVSAGAEILTEKISGGIKFGGKTLDDVATKFLARNVSDKVGRTILKLMGDMAGEGLEEVLSGVMSAVGQKLTYASDKELEELFTKEDAWESFIGGAALGGAGSTVQAVNAAANGVDAVTGLTKNEQKVVDKVYKDELAKRKGNLTEKEKAKIYDRVLEDMEKGYISTDTIEEVLGGDTFNRYTQAAEWESSLQSEYDKLSKEYEKLYNMKNGQKSSKQVDRETFLRDKLPQLEKQLNNVKETSSLSSMREQLSNEVFSLVKGDRLAESYKERARTTQKFEADLTQYDKKYHAAIQRAIDSGVLNNTNRSHELVDLAAKLEADKGITIDFANNQKIKESGFAVEGKIVNGYKTKTGIGINVQSPKYLNSTVGHEITHVLEGTEAYKVLSESIKNYAIAKEGLKGYNARLAEIEKLYKGMKDTTPEAELVSDLVGDYLFTDSDFVSKLSTEDRDLFQKVWDEIKYFCKIVTAGSKEARELERVKKAFEDAYRAGTKAEGGTKHSLSDLTFDDIMKMSDEEIDQELKKLGWDGSLELDDDLLLDDDFSFDDIIEEVDAEPEVVKVLFRRKGLGDSHIEDNRKAVMTQKRIDQRIAEHGAGMTDYARRYITRISPKDFIDMTVYERNMDREMFDSRVRGDLDSKMGEWDYEQQLKDSEEPPVLIIDKSTGQIIGHNGRHRMRALEMAGVESVEIEVEFHDEDGRMIKYNSETIPDMAISSQFDTAIETHISNIVPLNKAHRTEILNSYGETANADAGVKYSVSDSDGKQLTKEQQEYFKDSKVRDENGNLKVMYHGTPNGDFTVFKDGTYFTDNKEYADTYQNPGASSISTGKTATNPKTFEVYLDIKKPFDIADAEARDIYINDYIKGGNAMGINPYLSDAEYAKIDTIDWTEGEDLRDFLIDNGYDYDGLVLDEGATGGYGDEVKSRGKSYVVFSPEQVKNIDNQNPTADPDIRFSLSDARTYAEITEEQQKLYQREHLLAERKREAINNPELLQAMDDYSNLFAEVRGLLAKKHQGIATQEELDRIEEIKVLREERMKHVADLQESLGLNAISQEETEIRETKEALRVAADAAWAREGAEKENKAIAKAGISAPEYFRKKALKAFKTTTNFNEAGYMLPDGKLLNFSGGERNHRYRDHREIGEIYEATNGVAALNRFLSDGNIRIMAESPGIDLASGVEPTREQYAALRKFINSNGVSDGRFFVDFSDTDGRSVGKYAYNGRIFADRIINDIKYFFQTGNVRESSGLMDFLSLSNAGQQQKQYGTWNISGKDVAYVDPNATVEQKTQLTEESSTEADMFPDDLAPIQYELERLTDEEAEMRSVMEGYASVGDIDAVNKLIPEHEAIRGRIRELEAEDNQRADSLTDADAPPEMDAPYTETTNAPVENPFEDRNWSEVTGKKGRKAKAYMYEHPEVKPFFQAEAQNLLGEWSDTQRGEKFYNDQVYYESGGEKGWMGVKRLTSKSMETMLDEWGMSYDDIEKGLKAIIEDNGAENISAAKKIEFMLNDRLLNGYKNFYDRGYVQPNQDYINLLEEMQINSYSKEAFDEFMATADQYAPVAQSEPVPLKKATPDTMDAPIYESKDKSALKGQTTMFEPPKPNPKVATVLTEESAIEKEKSGIRGKLVSALVDKGMVFENLSLKTGNHELQAKYNYALPSNTEARAQHFMENGADGVKSLKDIKKTVEKSKKADDFSNYLYHVHNIDRMTLEDRFGVENKTVFGETVTAEVSRRKAAQYEKANPEFKDWANDVYAYNKHLRNLLVESSVISQETADLWEQMYPHYVPIRRVDSNGQNISVPLDTNKTGVNNPVKRATGGSSDIQPVFATMAQRTEQTYRAIARNAFGIELKNTLGTTLNSQENTTGVDETIDTLVAQEDHLLKAGTMSSNPTFTVFEDGERVEFEITEDMYDALKPAGKLLGYRNKAINAVGNARRNLLTTLNPVFALYRNPIKDIQDVAVNSQHAARTYLNVPYAVVALAADTKISKSIFGNTAVGKYAAEYHENGGKSNTYFDSRTNQFKAEDNIFKKAIGMPIRAIETAGEFIEEIPRLAEYIASRQSGRSVERSMLDAARVTTNFAAGGDFTKFLNSHGFTFLNASVQGASQHVRNFREAKQEGMKGYAKVLAKYTIAGLPTILLNSMLWDDDEDYEELSDYVKQNYYVVAKTQDGKFVRIPKGRTAAVIGELMEQMQNLVTGDDEADFSTFNELFWNNIAPSNPIENNILAPIGQVMANKAWYGGELVPSRLQKLPNEEQFDESTDSISKWLGEKSKVLSDKTGLDVTMSPYKLNYLLDQYSGGLGDVFLPMLTPEAESGDNSFAGNMLAPWKKEITTDMVLNNKNPGDFYDLRDEMEIKSNSRNATEEDKMRTMYMDSVSWEMSDLYAQKREIQSGNLNDVMKYRKVREVQEQINELAKNALSVYDHVEINGLYSEVGDKRYNKDEESGKWYEIREKNSDGSDNYYYQKEQEVTQALGISYGDYWNNREEYNFAYDKPEQYALARSVGGYDSYRSYTSDLYDIKADKDKNGKSISGSRKEKVIDWLNEQDIDYYHKIILFKNEYNADDTYNMEIIEYLNSRQDISYRDMEFILKYLGFEVDSEGNISW